MREFEGKKAAVCWTGGKDCHLASVRAVGDMGLEIAALVVFHPAQGGVSKFRAHRIELMRAQAKCMNAPLVLMEIDAEKFDGDYKLAYAGQVSKLKETHSVDVIVTGDIDYVGTSKTNFMTDVCNIAGIPCLLPLWQQDRKALLNEMLKVGLDIRFSCVKSPFFDASWIGRELNEQAILEMQGKPGLDLTGENGEFHTMVLFCPKLYKSARLTLQDVVPEELKGMAGQKEGEQWWVMSVDSCLKVSISEISITS